MLLLKNTKVSKSPPKLEDLIVTNFRTGLKYAPKMVSINHHSGNSISTYDNTSINCYFIIIVFATLFSYTYYLDSGNASIYVEKIPEQFFFKKNGGSIADVSKNYAILRKYPQFPYDRVFFNYIAVNSNKTTHDYPMPSDL